MKVSQRIPVALLSKSFSFGQAKALLLSFNEEIAPDEYERSMSGMLFCPACTVPLIRVPSDKDITSSSRIAYFRHRPGYGHINCGFRVRKKPGEKFTSEESISQAIQDGELAYIHGWMEEPPEINPNSPGIYNGSQVEDKAGPESEVSLGRHDGRTFKVPSTITSVYSLCAEFPQKLAKYFYFPKERYPLRLMDALVDLRGYEKGWVGSSRLYYGKIIDFYRLNKRDRIILETGEGTLDVYAWIDMDKRRNIDHGVVGRWLLIHGEIRLDASTPRMYADLWGEYAVLPKKYESTLISLRKIKQHV